MSFPLENERYTYADYCTWDDSERWEPIEGVPYAMSINDIHAKDILLDFDKTYPGELNNDPTVQS